MIRIILFEVLQLAVSGYALLRGGVPERWVAALLLAASWATLLASAAPVGGFRTVEVYRLSIDLALAAGLTLIALRANRFWPLWIAGFQLMTVGLHGVRAYDPAILPIVYSRLTSQVAYPMCLVLALGTWHYRRRARNDGAPPSAWSPLRP